MNGIGAANYEYAGSMPSGFNNEIRYQDRVEYERVAQYENMMNAQRQQMAASRNTQSATSYSFGNGAGDELSRRMYQRQAVLDKYSKASGVVQGAADLGIYQGASAAAGLAGAGFVAGMAAPLAVAAAVMVPITKGMKENISRKKEAFSIANDFDQYRGQLGFSHKMNFQETTSAGYQMRHMMNGSSGGFFGSDQLQRIHKIGMSNGLMTAKGGMASGSLEQYKKNFKELTETTEEIVKTLKTTIEGGMSVMKELKQSGMSTSQIKHKVKEFSAVAGATGETVQNIMSMSRAGANAVQGTPWTARTGSDMYVSNMASVSDMMNNSNVRGSVKQLGGVAQAGAVMANAQMAFMSSGYGTKMMAYMMDSKGNVDEGRKNRILDGEAGAYEVVNGANRRGYNMGASGRVNFERRKNAAFNEMSSEERSQMFESGFDMWRKGRGGNKSAQAAVFARQFGRNAAEVNLLQDALTAVKGFSKLDANKMMSTQAAAEEAGNYGDNRGVAFNAMKSAYRSDILIPGVMSLKDGWEGLKTTGRGLDRFFNSKNSHRFYGAVGDVIKGSLNPFDMTMGFGSAARRYGGDYQDASTWQKLKRGIGMVSEYETFATSSLMDPSEARAANLGLTMSDDAAMGISIMRANAIAGIADPKLVKRKKWGGYDPLRGRFAKANARDMGVITEKIRTAYEDSDGGLKLVDDSDFLRSLGIKAGSREHKRLRSEARSGDLLTNLSGVVNDYDSKKSEILTRSKEAVERSQVGLGAREQSRQVRRSNTAYEDYKRTMADKDKRSDLGIKNTASFSEWNEAAKRANLGSTSNSGYTYTTANTEFERLNSQHQENIEKANAVSKVNAGIYDTDKTKAAERIAYQNLLKGADQGGVLRKIGNFFSGGIAKKIEHEYGIDLKTGDGIQQLRAAINEKGDNELWQVISRQRRNGTMSEAEFEKLMNTAEMSTETNQIAAGKNYFGKRAQTYIDTTVTSKIAGSKKLSKKSQKSKDAYKARLKQVILEGDDQAVKDLINNTEFRDYNDALNLGVDFLRENEDNLAVAFKNTTLALETTEETSADNRAAAGIAASEAKAALNAFIKKKGDQKYDVNSSEYKKQMDLQKAADKADDKLKSLTADPSASAQAISARPSAVNPPVLNYWNNSWAVR